MSKNSTEPHTLWCITIILVVLAGAILRFYQLNSGLWFDEIRTLVGSVRPSLLSIVTHFPSNNDHLLYSVLAHLSISVFGEHAWSLRLPAALFGIASLPMIYLLGRQVTSRFDALMATIMLTFSYHHIWFSQNARGYTALLFWTLLATWLILKWYSGNNRSALLAYAVVAALGSYTHLTMVFVVISHALVLVWVLFLSRPMSAHELNWKHAAGGFVLSGILTIVLYIPMMFEVHSFFSDIPAQKKVETPLWALLATLRGLQIGLGQVWVLLAAGLVFTAGILGYYCRHRIALALFLLPAPVTLGIALAMGRPVYPRFLFFLMGFGLLIAVQGAASIGQWLGSRKSVIAGDRLGKLMVAGLTAGVVGLSLTSLPYGYNYPKQDYLQAVEYVQQNQASGDVVAALGLTAAFPLINYLEQPWLRIDTLAQFDQLVQSGETVWVIYTLPAYLENSAPLLMQTVERDCVPARSFHGTVEGGRIVILKCPARTIE